MKIEYICIGHAAPIFNPPVKYKLFCSRPCGIESEIIVDDNRFGGEIDGTALAEYSQFFALADMIENGDINADYYYLFQYRKFISPILGGSQANAPWVKILNREEAGICFPSEDLLVSSNKIKTGGLFDFGMSISKNYSLVHEIDDLVMFSAACAESPYINEDIIRELATFRGIIPSPALCYIDAVSLIRISKVLKDVWIRYVTKYQIVREGYQRRVSGYLLERLHSILLCQWLRQGENKEIEVWNRYVIAV